MEGDAATPKGRVEIIPVPSSDSPEREEGEEQGLLHLERRMWWRGEAVAGAAGRGWWVGAGRPVSWCWYRRGNLFWRK